MAGQYGAGNRTTSTTGVTQQTTGAADHEHGYEWEQAREEERLAREQPPPGYNVAARMLS